MKEIIEISLPQGAKNLSDMAFAMQEAAIAHSYDLNIDHDRMLEDFGCLWMLVRYDLRLSRLPVGALRVETFLRSPSAAFSHRDFSFYDELGLCGEGVQVWVVADANERKLRMISDIPPLLEGPFRQPERSSRPKRVRLPKEMEVLDVWTVAPEEIDDNGHLNNVAYLRHAEKLVPPGCTALEVCFERECFCGEKLLLKGNLSDEGYFIQICKENGEESFRACFRKESPE